MATRPSSTIKAPIFVAAVIAWMAEVFRRGEALEADVAGLV